jgi:tagaturonate reductase
MLNGPHTVMAPVGYLSGLNTVSEILGHEVLGAFVNKVMFEELMETLDLPKSDLEKFGKAVLDRFRNPFVNHYVTSIMLNSFPKFKTRDLPGLKTYLERKGELPKGIVLGLAAMCTYYKGGKRGKDEISLNDEQQIINLLAELWGSEDTQTVAEGVLDAEFIWGEDLNLLPGLTQALKENLDAIRDNGMLATVKSIL